MEPTYDNILKPYNVIRSKTLMTPKIGIICGSGLGKIAHQITDSIFFHYSELPGFVTSQVVGHNSRLILGKLNGVEVICMQGRFHGYEGIKHNAVCFPIRVMKLLGVETLIITHAAGGIDRNFKTGDFMIVKDHLPIFLWNGNNPLIGPNEEKFGPRFFATDNLYDKELRKLAKQVAINSGLEQILQEGVVAMISGPNYEGIAEAQFLDKFGVGSVGMSVCGEALVAGHCGIKVLALSLITDMVPLTYEKVGDAVNHEEVIAMANERGNDMVKYVNNLVLEISKIGSEKSSEL